MQLTYRGVSYPVSSKETKKSTVSTVGKYRGVPVEIEFYQTEPQLNASLPLKYRGITYFSSKNHERKASRI